MLRATTSRGASSASRVGVEHEAAAGGVEQHRALAAHRLGDEQGRRPARDPSAASVVGWNWKNSRSRTAAPARQAAAMPSAVATAGLVVWGKSWPAPPVASTTASAASSRAVRRPGGPPVTRAGVVLPL